MDESLLLACFLLHTRLPWELLKPLLHYRLEKVCVCVCVCVHMRATVVVPVSGVLTDASTCI